MSRQITITVSDEEAQKIDERVAAGDYASPEEFVEAAVTFFELEPDWMPPDDVLKALVEEALEDPRRYMTEEVHEYILERQKQHNKLAR